MATKTAPRGAAPAPVTAIVPTPLDHEQVMALLGQAGMIAKGSDGGFRRMQLRGGSLITDPDQPDEEAWPPTKRGPTMTVRIVKPPIYYNAHWLGAERDERGEPTGAIDPVRIGRPDLNGKFVKKYDDPNEQAADGFSNVEVYEEISKLTGNRGAFKGDIQLQIVPESGEMTGDEPIYTLTLSTTAALDWRGSSKNPSGGVVQDKNFIVQLAEFAQAKAIEAGVPQEQLAKAVLDAMTALNLGGVVADIYLLQASNGDKSRTWTVPAFRPVHIASEDDLPALPAGDTIPEAEASGDDIPF